MKFADVSSIVVVAAVAALVAGAVGLVLGRLLRHRSIRWQLALVAVVPVAGLYLGVLAVGRLMFISAHDLLVMSVVTSVAAVVAVGIAMLVAVVVARWSEALHDQVRSFDRLAGRDLAEDDDRPIPGTFELRSLADELDRTRRRLQESHDREQRLEEARRELVSWVSHDLRTPLAGLRAMTEALEDGMVDDPGRYHRQMTAEVDRMSSMVDDLLELSRIHAGVLSVAPEPVLLADLVSEALAAAEPVARSRGVRLRGEVDDGIELNADPGGLARVLANLLSNAVRHTETGGEVEIRGRADANGIRVEVSDGCGGLSADDMARVFDVAWQAAPARTPEQGDGRGAGLGLAIVKGIVEAHHGRVEVENSDERDGCRFRIVFPSRAEGPGAVDRVVSGSVRE